jgi:cell division protein FtsW (lipid II flippase)
VHDAHGRTQPSPLVVAASLVAVEGVLLVAYAVLEAADVHADRAAMGVTTALFFAALGAALMVCAWLVVRGRAWARSPIVVAQVMFLGVAWSFLGGATTWVSVALAVVAVVVLVGLLHPSSVDALSEHGDGTP